jgi:hypothetical protein
MTTTVAEIRRRAVLLARTDGRVRGFATRDGVNALLATTGTALTLTDDIALPPTGAAELWSAGDWLFLPEAVVLADRKRLVASYDAAARTITHWGPDYDAGTIALLEDEEMPYLILKDDPDLWQMALIEALRTILSAVTFFEFTPTASLARYDIDASPISLLDLGMNDDAGIQRASQILDIEVHAAGSADDTDDLNDENAWLSWSNGQRTWRAYNVTDTAGNTVYIDFGASPPQTTDRLRIKYATQYPAATADEDDDDLNVDEYWAALATLSVMADWLGDPNNPDDDWNIIGRRVKTQYFAQRRLILGENAFRQVSRSTRSIGSVGVRGRRRH